MHGARAKRIIHRAGGGILLASALIVAAGPTASAMGPHLRAGGEDNGNRWTVCAGDLTVRDAPGGRVIGVLYGPRPGMPPQTFTVHQGGGDWVRGHAWGDVNRTGYVENGWFCPDNKPAPQQPVSQQPVPQQTPQTPPGGPHLRAAKDDAGKRWTICARDIAVRQSPGGPAIGTLYGKERGGPPQTFTIHDADGEWVRGHAWGGINKTGYIQNGWFCPENKQVAPPIATASKFDPVKAYAPYIYLAKGEKYEPTSAMDFVKKAELWWAHDGGIGCARDDREARDINPLKLGRGEYKHQIADKICRDHGVQHPSNKLSRPRKAGKDGIPDKEGFYFKNVDGRHYYGDASTAPAYYEYEPHRFVTYWFFYAFNDAPSKTNLGFDAPTNALDHEGDFERISIKLNSRNRAETVAYYQHGHYCTISWQNAGKHDGRPLAYSALGTHGTYPKARHYPLAEGLGHDTANRGEPYDTLQKLGDARGQHWYGYGGAWGEVGEGTHSTGPVGPRFQGSAPPEWRRPCRF